MCLEVLPITAIVYIVFLNKSVVHKYELVILRVNFKIEE